MVTIKQLPPDVIAKIAAGEVIERPASVVKELVENAVDAGASIITIAVTHGGIQRIQVTDNGVGMSGDDLEMCVRPHATSKISSDADLESIATLGFRGEALSSIAAASTVVIRSRPINSERGEEIQVIQGEVDEKMPVGMPVGTRVTVDYIFKTLPARKKFLKNPVVEFRSIATVVTQAALAAPAIGFTLERDGETVFQVPPEQKLLDRIITILGKSVIGNLIPIAKESEHGSVNGFIGAPQIAVPARNHQYIYINGRPVKSKVFLMAIRGGYGSSIMPKMNPVVILHVTLPTSYLDVNIHPRKESVDILHSTQVQAFMRDAVAEALATHISSYAQTSSLYDPDAGADSHMASVLRDSIEPWHVYSPREEEDLPIAQVHNVYLVTQTAQGMRIIDQHAAHERILYEQFVDGYKAEIHKQKQHTFPTATVFELSLPESILLLERIEFLQQLGFDIEPFGNTSWKVNAVPRIYAERDIAMLLREVIADIQEDADNTSLDVITQRTLSFLACRTAIKAGDPLTLDQRKELLRKLGETKTNYTCPHGRPVHIDISLPELHKMFRRI